MKRILFNCIVTICIVSFLSCAKTGRLIVPPEITLLGDNPDTVVQFSTDHYVDPGYYAVDHDDGSSCPVLTTGSVDMGKAGCDTLLYYALSNDNLLGDAFRTVVVDGAPYLTGNYSIEKFTGGLSQGEFSDTISSDTQSANKIWFHRFANYQDATIYGTLQGTIITIPAQMLWCGNPSVFRSFEGTGNYSADSNSFVIGYIEISSGGTVYGTCVFTKE